MESSLPFVINKFSCVVKQSLPCSSSTSICHLLRDTQIQALLCDRKQCLVSFWYIKMPFVQGHKDLVALCDSRLSCLFLFGKSQTTQNIYFLWPGDGFSFNQSKGTVMWRLKREHAAESYGCFIWFELCGCKKRDQHVLQPVLTIDVFEEKMQIDLKKRCGMNYCSVSLL